MYIPKLKPKSPFFNDAEDKKNGPLNIQRCEHPDCNAEGLYQAPKSRENLRERYYFCLDHVREYNACWDYFEGYTVEDIEHHIRQAATWERPTWRANIHPFFEKKLRKRIIEDFDLNESEFGLGSDEKTEKTKHEEKKRRKLTGDSPEIHALDVFDLVPPLDLFEIKTRYKELVKKHHPDINRENKEECEEKIKTINIAYAVLKAAYGRYEKIKKES